MRTERLLLLASVGLNLGLAALFLLQRREHLALAADLAARTREHQLLRQTHEASLAKPAALPAVASDADALELARLRNEVTRLRGDLRAATNAPAPRRTPPVAPVTSPAPAPGIRQLAAQVSVQVPLGQTLAMGGWAGARPGERIVSFITPTTDPAAPGTVLVQSHLIAVPDRLLDRLGLQDLRSEADASQNSAALDPARFAALLKFAEGERGVEVLSAPRVLTPNGQSATISVRQARPDGTETGPLLKLTPTLDATGANVRLEVGLEVNLTQP
jgi:hypothetical protein